MKNNLDKVTHIRSYKEGDHNFILSTWLKGLRYGNQLYGLIDQEIYYKVYHEFIENLLKRKDTEVLVLCFNDDPDTLLGYSVVRKNRTILDFSFVKASWRGNGIFNHLTPQSVNTCTHVTKAGIDILKKRTSVKFNPFAL